MTVIITRTSRPTRPYADEKREYEVLTDEPMDKVLIAVGEKGVYSEEDRPNPFCKYYRVEWETQNIQQDARYVKFVVVPPNCD